MYLTHFVASLLSQLNISWAWLTNAPMPQLLSVFDCVVKAKYFVFYSTHFCAWLLALASRHYVIASVSKIVRDFSEAFGAISRSETENTSRFKRVRLTHSRQSPGFWILDFHL